MICELSLRGTCGTLYDPGLVAAGDVSDIDLSVGLVVLEVRVLVIFMIYQYASRCVGCPVYVMDSSSYTYCKDR